MSQEQEDHVTNIIFFQCTGVIDIQLVMTTNKTLSNISSLKYCRNPIAANWDSLQRISSQKIIYNRSQKIQPGSGSY